MFSACARAKGLAPSRPVAHGAARTTLVGVYVVKTLAATSVAVATGADRVARCRSCCAGCWPGNQISNMSQEHEGAQSSATRFPRFAASPANASCGKSSAGGIRAGYRGRWRALAANRTRRPPWLRY
eukprot:4419087-Pleurochrysis_carterae.AAC.5